MINLYAFLVIKPDLLNKFIDTIGANLNLNSEMYIITLLIANLLAYLVIFLVYKIAITIYYIFVPKEIRRHKVL